VQVTEISHTEILEESEGEIVVALAHLSNGLRIIVENVPSERTVSAGVWIAAGSCDDPTGYEGAGHFLEHLFFSGTQRRTEREIADLAADLGDTLGAFTGHEYAACYTQTRTSDLPQALDLLLDMAVSSAIRAPAVERERQAILDEIASRTLDPSDSVFECFTEQIYHGTSAAHSILGTNASVEAIHRDRIAEHYHRNSLASRVVVAIAGNVDARETIGLAASLCAQTEGISRKNGPSEPPRHRGLRPNPVSGARVVEMSTDHAAVILGTLGYSRHDDSRFAAAVISRVLGGGVDSRLFREIRVKRGLAFNVYSYLATGAAAGQFGIFAGCLPGRVEEALEICRNELEDIQAFGVTPAELQDAKRILMASALFAEMDVSARMTYLAKSQLCYDAYHSPSEQLAKLDSVTLGQVNETAALLRERPLTLAIAGPFWGRDFSAFTR
jgi:predicted Zn-dependent peptidase